MFQDAQTRRGTGSRGPKPFWSPEDLELTLDMWAKGYSARQIAQTVGVSRSAVLGKLHRQKIKGADVERPRASPKPRMAPKLKPPVFLFVPKMSATPYIEPTEYDACSRRIRLEQTSPTDCRYIVEGTGAHALYCGMAKPIGRGFCDHHHSRCFYKSGTER